MPKITSVEPQEKNLHRFNIFLDGIFTLGADEDLVVEYRLVVGREIDTPLLEKLLFEAEVGKLMERMYRLWNVRPRSEKEVRDYLRDLSFKRKAKDKDEVSQAAADLLVEKLKQKKLLDDQSFAKAWVESRRKTKKKGKIALRQELFQKGIDREIIDKVITDMGYEISEEELAEQALEKKIKIWQSLPYLEKKKKAYEYLLRRGFEYEVVKSVVEKKSQKS
ncbi:RecX family transcriptional regulator [Candidatus Daviesbacteria bacterium]|nr:RecX family transcriptional regulator [Candidatus Daviesbacteria bacterium]